MLAVHADVAFPDISQQGGRDLSDAVRMILVIVVVRFDIRQWLHVLFCDLDRACRRAESLRESCSVQSRRFDDILILEVTEAVANDVGSDPMSVFIV